MKASYYCASKYYSWKNVLSDPKGLYVKQLVLVVFFCCFYTGIRQNVAHSIVYQKSNEEDILEFEKLLRNWEQWEARLNRIQPIKFSVAREFDANFEQWGVMSVVDEVYFLPGLMATRHDIEFTDNYFQSAENDSIVERVGIARNDAKPELVRLIKRHGSNEFFVEEAFDVSPYSIPEVYNRSLIISFPYQSNELKANLRRVSIEYLDSGMIRATGECFPKNDKMGRELLSFDILFSEEFDRLPVEFSGRYRHFDGGESNSKFVVDDWRQWQGIRLPNQFEQFYQFPDGTWKLTSRKKIVKLQKVSRSEVIRRCDSSFYGIASIHRSPNNYPKLFWLITTMVVCLLAIFVYFFYRLRK